jgi:CBS-domain-containing membrane protein
MANHQVRRLPVIEDHTLVGMLAQADVAPRCRGDRGKLPARGIRGLDPRGTQAARRDHHREDQCA